MSIKDYPQKLDIIALYADSRKSVGMLESEVAHLEHELKEAKISILEYQTKLIAQEKELAILRARTLEVRSEEAYKNLRMQIKRCSEDRKRLRKNVEQLVVRLAAEKT